MSLLEDIARLNEGLTPEDLLKLDEKRGIAEQSERWQRINTAQPSHSGELAGGPRMSGKGSWYSQLPQYGWVDREDKPGSNALGVPDDEQGIALPSRKTLGQWFDVTFPNGETHRLQQTDVGPAQWTGKGIDISAAAAHKAGFTPKDFPTGGGFTWSPAEGPPGPQTYDTEDRTAAGIGLTRNAPPEANAFDPTGQKRMADDPTGILPALGMKNQQPQGLLGALGDPETMSYIAMMLKGFNPYSNLDPNSMLSAAHTNALRKQALMQQEAERATDNQRADRALNLREQEYGLSRSEREDRNKALQADRDERTRLLREERERQEKEREQQRDTIGKVYGGLGSTPTVEQIDQALANPYLPKDVRDDLEKRRTRMTTEDKDKAIPAELAGRLGMADVYLKKAPEIGKAIDAGELTGLIDQPLAKFGGALGGASAEKYRDMQSGVDALTRMMTGAGMPASEAEAYAQRYLPAWNDDAKSLRSKHDRLVQELQTIKSTVEKGRIKSPGASPGGGNATRDALKSKYGLE